MFKKLLLSTALALSLGAAQAAPVLDAGWAGDDISDRFVDSDASPYAFTLTGSAWFRITDFFNTGDQFFVYDNLTLILTTSLDGAQASITPIGDADGDAGWTSASYQHGAVLLAAGSHSLRVQGDGIGGIPAGFYTRLDTASVPEPGTMALLGAALAGLGFVRRRKQ